MELSNVMINVRKASNNIDTCLDLFKLNDTYIVKLSYIDGTKYIICETLLESYANEIFDNNVKIYKLTNK